MLLMTADTLNTAIILPLADSQATLAQVGGKGASLARLAQAGLPVPTGFYITTATYQQFVAENQLQPGIEAALAQADLAQPPTLEAASVAIRALFAAAPMPAPLATTIAQAYAALADPAGEAQWPVAVRSSATAEDLPELSFAGQQETYLNICGAAAVLVAVQRCWGSLWTARAIGYRLQHHIDQQAISLAVVVQTLVPAEAAGVLFTAHPLTGQRNQAMLTATWGLGEALVGGLVSPDTLVVEKNTGQVVSRAIAEKQVMTVRVAGGTKEQLVPEAQRRAPVLTDQQAATLVRLGVQIEQLYGRPMDIEWTWAADTFAIVQARPITALPEPTAPVTWERPDPRAWCYRASITEQLPDPLSPLFATLGCKAIGQGSAQLFNILFGGDQFSAGMFITINGYAYYQMRFTLGMIPAIFRATIKFWPEFMRSEARWRDDAHVRYTAVIERWRNRPANALTATEILEAARQLTAEMVYTYNVLQSGVLGLAGSVELIFTLVYERLIQRPADPPATTFLVGYESLPLAAEKSLYALAALAHATPALAEHFLRTPALQLAAQLADLGVPANLPADVWEAWKQAFVAHLEKYGHALYDLDFAKPVAADQPGPLLETCRMYLRGQGTNPHERQQAQIQRREQALQAIESRVKGWRLKLFRKTLGWAQSFAPMREDCLADLGLGYPLLRRLLRELGRRLTAAGMLPQPEEVYWLTEEELAEAAAVLDKGAPLPSAAEKVAQRRATWRAQKALTPPSSLPEKSRFSRYIEAIGPARTRQTAHNQLKGVGASPGQVTGPARVLQGPEDFDQMQPGEILVAAITTPAWTPLFARATAVVTDIGGILSHGSIVAREYGIPAVLGTGVATKRIHSGQIITVDGGKGVVTWN